MMTCPWVTLRLLLVVALLLCECVFVKGLMYSSVKYFDSVEKHYINVEYLQFYKYSSTAVGDFKNTVCSVELV